MPIAMNENPIRSFGSDEIISNTANSTNQTLSRTRIPHAVYSGNAQFSGFSPSPNTRLRPARNPPPPMPRGPAPYCRPSHPMVQIHPVHGFRSPRANALEQTLHDSETKP